MKIYVASSWRNQQQPAIVETLRDAGHIVYDFRNPTNGDKGFDWTQVDKNWQQWTAKQYRKALVHPAAQRGFKNDFQAMVECSACLLLLPCGRSAHLEAGWFVGQRKLTLVLTQDGEEPELMALMLDHICVSMDEVLQVLHWHENERGLL